MLHGFLDYKQRNQKPLARHKWASEPILDFNLKTPRLEDTMDKILQFRAVDVIELISGDSLSFIVIPKRNSITRSLNDATSLVYAKRLSGARWYGFPYLSAKL